MSYDLQICWESLDNHCSLAFGERGRGRGGWEGERGKGGRGKGKGVGRLRRGRGKDPKAGKGGGVAAGKEKSDIRVSKCCFYTFFKPVRFGPVQSV